MVVFDRMTPGVPLRDLSTAGSALQEGAQTVKAKPPAKRVVLGQGDRRPAELGTEQLAEARTLERAGRLLLAPSRRLGQE